MGVRVSGGRRGGGAFFGAVRLRGGGVAGLDEAGARAGGAFSGAAAEGPAGAGPFRGCGPVGATVSKGMGVGWGGADGAFIAACARRKDATTRI